LYLIIFLDSYLLGMNYSISSFVIFTQRDLNFLQMQLSLLFLKMGILARLFQQYSYYLANLNKVASISIVQ